MLASIPISILLIGLFATGGLAAWAMMVQHQNQFQIQSGQRLELQTTFGEIVSLTAEGDGASGSETIAVTNSNGPMDCVLTYGLTSTDDDTDDCTDYTNDLDIVVKFASQNRTSGDTVTLQSGAGNFFDCMYEAVEWSCPQDAVFDFELDCS